MKKRRGATAKGYLEKATDPRQYDAGEINWSNYGKGDHPIRTFYKEVLRKELGNLEGKRVLDVGSGSGAFFDFIKELGALEIQGIEPSATNYEISKKLFPQISVFHGELRQSQFAEQFDLILAIMVFEHILDLPSAYGKIHSLLKNGGKFCLIFQDEGRLLDPNFDQPVDFENTGNGVIVSKVVSFFGTTYNLLRPTNTYIKTAEENGFILEKHLPLFPSESLCRAIPRYKNSKGKPIRHLLVLVKK